MDKTIWKNLNIGIYFAIKSLRKMLARALRKKLDVASENVLLVDDNELLYQAWHVLKRFR
jgi:hypothetical protein